MILRKMAEDMRVPLAHIELLATTANHRYKIYRIPKRTGGTREISHPSKELKSLQRWLALHLFSRLPIHDSVYSYRIGVGIRDHAEIHKRGNYLVRIDLKDFFPSITSKDVARLLIENRQKLGQIITATDLKAICWIVCRNGRLTIGAPSSPVISNAVLYAVDKNWSATCEQRGITYSRYADDIYLSTNRPNILAGTYDEMRKDLENREWPKLQINRRKVVFTSRKHNRNVTGLILTSDRRVSIGHEKKRRLRSQVFKFTQGQLSAEHISYLRGYLSFAKSVEPSFLTRLRKKFGVSVIHQIANTQPIQIKKIKARKK